MDILGYVFAVLLSLTAIAIGLLMMLASEMRPQNDGNALPGCLVAVVGVVAIAVLTWQILT